MKVVITWVQPKYLDKGKISILHDRLDQWINRSNKVFTYFGEESKKVLLN